MSTRSDVLTPSLSLAGHLVFVANVQPPAKCLTFQTHFLLQQSPVFDFCDELMNRFLSDNPDSRLLISRPVPLTTSPTNFRPSSALPPPPPIAATAAFSEVSSTYSTSVSGSSVPQSPSSTMRGADFLPPVRISRSQLHSLPLYHVWDYFS